MRIAQLSLLLAVIVTAGGCYHIRVETGRPANGQTFEKDFALGFIFGLIPPPTQSTAAQCPGGVAVVESEMSFVGGLINAITGGLVNPFDIHVECAGGTASLPADAEQVAVAADAKPAELNEAFKEATDLAVATGEPVYVRFD